MGDESNTRYGKYQLRRDVCVGHTVGTVVNDKPLMSSVAGLRCLPGLSTDASVLTWFATVVIARAQASASRRLDLAGWSHSWAGALGAPPHTPAPVPSSRVCWSCVSRAEPLDIQFGLAVCQKVHLLAAELEAAVLLSSRHLLSACCVQVDKKAFANERVTHPNKYASQLHTCIHPGSPEKQSDGIDRQRDR